MSRVRHLKEWLDDPKYMDVVVGSVFVILGGEDTEMSCDEWKWHARVVYQGSEM